ncbi:MAG: hypothetical protein J1E16_07695 [Muribaculaceae bacterium]|nr:hypothetical protein [Muribaculaceae bacterium]
MKNPLQSTLVAWIALFIVVIVIIFTFQYRQQWWSFIDLFFAFMMVFCQLAGLYIGRFNPYAGKTLQNIAAWCLGLMILAFIGEYIAYQVLIP